MSCQKLHRVSMLVCDACIDGAFSECVGGECACANDLPARNNPAVTIDGWGMCSRCTTARASRVVAIPVGALTVICQECFVTALAGAPDTSREAKEAIRRLLGTEAE